MRTSKKKQQNKNVVKPEPKKRNSMRRYPPRECMNPYCKMIFTPTDKRQIFDEPQCRIDYNNDLRKAKTINADKITKIHAANQAALKKVKIKLDEMVKKSISLDLLLYEGYKPGYSTDKTMNLDTKNQIEWNYYYGLESYSEAKNTFIIHFRNELPF